VLLVKTKYFGLSSVEAELCFTIIENQGHKRTKHMAIKYHHLREVVEHQEVRMEYCRELICI
jgi:hypothetical protein